MLNSLKAISLGIATIIILGLINQLILIMASVGYNLLLNIYPELTSWRQVFTYTISAVCYFIVMASAGYITAMASKQSAYIHTAIAAILGMSLSLYLSLQQEIFTLRALFFIIIGLVFALLGCRRWLSSQKAVALKCQQNSCCPEP